MRKFSFVALALTFLATSAVQAQQYALDQSHAAVTFQISHMGLSWTAGRFNKMDGEISLDRSAPENSTFSLTIAADSIDTGNEKRDDHLRSPDFFNVKQFPTITFKSTKVAPIENGYEVTGDLTMHGETKPVTFKLKGGAEKEIQGTAKTGFTTNLVIKRLEFGIGTDNPALGNEVHTMISFEAARK